MRTNAIMSGIVLGAVAVGARASQAEQDSERKKAEWFVGAGAIVTSKPHTGVDAKVYAVPLFGYEGERLYLRGIIGGYRLLKGERWSFGPVLRPRLEGYDADDSAALAGMSDRRASLDAGAEWSWLADWGLIGVTLVTDVLGQHHGQELELSYTALFPYGGFEFIPSVALRWRSSNMVDYYYGVRPEEAMAGRPAYAADNTFTPLLRLMVRRKLSEKWSALGAVQYEWFASEITDSPIVEDDYATSFMLGLTYTF
ncbi:MAG: MipA/OmpV family protein [Sedimentisphaerales bacterium]|nr:MipA/OmpV family protein [Sedimentisphaerales bacterium]